MSEKDTMEVNFADAPEGGELENPLLKESVEPTESKLKELIVDYVGAKLDPEDGNVTVEMTLQVFAEEFKEFVLPLAEENWIRGYEQAFLDIEEGKKLVEQDFPTTKKKAKKSGERKRKS